MPRPRKLRHVDRPPLLTGFKPLGIRSSELQPIDLSLDEYEAIRLADHLGLDQSEAADQMDISRSTFSRLIERARGKVARFLIEGAHLRIGGGDVHFVGNRLQCLSCGNLFNTDLDQAVDVCPNCGSTKLVDLAGGFGHGRCCRRHQRRQGR
jgi:predicted DNA-binding protein (UPF0251 family)